MGSKNSVKWNSTGDVSTDANGTTTGTVTGGASFGDFWGNLNLGFGGNNKDGGFKLTIDGGW